MDEPQEAIIDHSTEGYTMLRCPHCNSWDRAWAGCEAGVVYICEECGERVKIPRHNW